MCTMTWMVKEGGYELFFNRDERVSRRRAELPTIQESAGIQYLSPTDTDAGGTWIAVNHFGISVCLLNHYEFEQIETYKKWTSRGEIVRRFATTENIDFVAERFSKLALDDYRAFRMFVIDRNGQNRLCIWDGHQHRIEVDVCTPKSSSSMDAKHVKTLRKKLFSDMRLSNSRNSSEFIQYHASHVPSKSMNSVCMHREDANTVSFSHIAVSGHAVEFSYADGPPCEAQLNSPLTMKLQDTLEGRSAHAPNLVVANI